MEIDVLIHRESDPDAYWAEVIQLPGCFAAGHSLGELEDSLQEAVVLYLEDENGTSLVSPHDREKIRRYRLSEDRRLVHIST